jgi:hypothetical protein
MQATYVSVAPSRSLEAVSLRVAIRTSITARNDNHDWAMLEALLR